jgi:chromosome segregation ATPase
MPANPTHDEIVRDAKAQIAAFDEKIRQINARMNEIRKKPRPLSSDDEKALDDLDHTQSGHLAAIRTIALVTLERLDNTDEVKRLVEQLRAVRTDLEERRARIQRFADIATAVGEGLAGVANLATRVHKVKEDIQHLGDAKPKPKSG